MKELLNSEKGDNKMKQAQKRALKKFDKQTRE